MFKYGRQDLPCIYIVLPCYNEEAVLPRMLPKFLEVLDDMELKGLCNGQSRILCVDDGSRDLTWDVIQSYYKKDSRIAGVRESRNFGHQAALCAGMTEAYVHDADIIITMDCDGQDNLDAIQEMVYKVCNNGFDLVYGVRSDRSKDSLFKRGTAGLYYKLMEFLGAGCVPQHADYRCMTREVVRVFLEYREKGVFLRGIFPRLGFKSCKVFYVRDARVAGESKYSFRKMLKFAADGIMSMSAKPLNLVLWLGFLVSGFSFAGCVWSFVTAMLGRAVPGWSSILCILCFIMGVQMLCIGVVGLYVGKIYDEVKDRPRFHIMERTGDKTDGAGRLDRRKNIADR